MATAGDSAEALAAGEHKASHGSDLQVENVAPNGKAIRRRVTTNPAWVWLWARRRNQVSCCVVLVVVICAVAFPLAFLVIYPIIAQNMVNGANIPVSAIVFAEPSADSARISLNASIKLPTPLTVRIDPLPLDLFVEDSSSNIVPYTNVTIPANKLHGNTSLNFADELGVIKDKTIFADFVRSIIFSETFSLSVTGTTHAYVSALKANIHLKKNLSLKGLNSLAGFDIPSAHLVLPADSDGTNLLADLFIPNQSVLTMELGNMTWNVVVGGYYLGVANMQNVVLLPGNNTIPARCVVDIKGLIRNLPQIKSAGGIKNGDLQIATSGNTTVYNGEHLDYYEQSLRQLTLTAAVPLLSILKGVASSSASLVELGSLLKSSSTLNIRSLLESIE